MQKDSAMYRKSPYIREIEYSSSAVQQLDSQVRESSERNPRRAKEHQVLFRYPTVYVVHDQTNRDDESPEFHVYVGETSSIKARTQQHLNADIRDRTDWKEFSESAHARMFVIGHEHFNKSLTLDIENRLMNYLVGVKAVKRLNNRRTNQQLDYYTQEEFDEIFTRVWRGLRRKNKKLFPTERLIRDSALFKASPFHKLSEEQLTAKTQILNAIRTALESEDTGQLILVTGDAGAGKTVLLSSLFFELFQGEDNSTDPMAYQDLDAYMLVNHEEQVVVYENIATRLGVLDKEKTRVSRPTRFINNPRFEREEPELADVVLIDEAHLLWTQGKQSYRGKNQLKDLLERARVVVAVFDKNQILAANQYWEEQEFLALTESASQTVHLTNQMRMDADPKTIHWVRSLIDDGIISPLPSDAKGYDIQIFESPSAMQEAIRRKTTESTDQGLSRVLATFDWAYSSASKPENGTWNVEIGDFSLPWNRETPLTAAEKRKLRGMSWAEQPHTIDEAGSTFTIQGFDLNYAGVILGPSVKWRDGRVIVDPSASKNRGATNKRTLSDGSKKLVAEDLLKNEINVLLTRGVHGLYIYAVDPPLRRKLREAQENRSIPSSS